MNEFDPEEHFTKDSSIFGLPKDMKHPSLLYLFPSPWEPTTSFKKGCSKGPKALFKASKQMDLYHPYFKNVYKKGIKWFDDFEEKILALNTEATKICNSVQSLLDSGLKPAKKDTEQVNLLSENFNQLIYENSLKLLQNNKTIGLIGGDHSSPYGLIKALTEFYKDSFSIVHIDAHFDFRNSYQGFTFSHASIMTNVMTKLLTPPKIFQLGIRDFCESEYSFANKHSQFLLDQELQKRKALGASFIELLDELFDGLDEKIYISFDIDGLSPEFCPNTGTPVPGGLSFSEAQFILEYLHRKGHQLIGFDLVEVSSNENLAPLGEGIDEVTAVRLLYSLSCYALSNK